tara:strand:+ start:382 stop:600 length:219 start_codon:yes stop_codon:yes gene_type:complete
MKAFPTHSINVNDEARVTAIGGESGMDLRDYFAAAALPMSIQEMNEAESFNLNDAATMAYHYADAMMKARGE